MNKTYAVTDLHGMWNLWEQISEYCDETDTIYFLGDSIDRGVDGLRIMESLLKDKRVIYLLGNHEEFFLEVAPQLIGLNEEEILVSTNDDFYLWLCNGGYDTMKAFTHLTREEQNWFLTEIYKLQDTDIYINKNDKVIHLSHAGTDPTYDKYDLMTFGNTNPYTWDRKHFFRPWAEELKDWYIVHGHTPVQYLSKKLNEFSEFYQLNKTLKEANEILCYCNGHKFDLDLGSFESKKVALFNLDELKVEKYFEVEED